MKTFLITLIAFAFATLTFAQNPLANYERTSGIEGTVVVSSKAFKNLFLRINPNGDVGTQTYPGGHETLVIEKTSDGYYSIRQWGRGGGQFRYLRMDGTGINAQSKAPGGVVNSQTYVGSYEKFKIEQYSDGSISIESVAFPGRFLNMNPNNVVRVQNRAGGHERFFLYKKK